MIAAGCGECICADRENILSAGGALKRGLQLSACRCELLGKGTPRGLEGAVPAIISAANASTRLLCPPAMLIRNFGDLIVHVRTAQLISGAA